MEQGYVNFKMEQGYLVLADTILERFRQTRKQGQEKRGVHEDRNTRINQPLTSVQLN